MMTSLLRNIAILSAVGFLTSSCGGGGGGGDVAGGGLSGTGISAGAITSFGSIFVNGVEFDTSGATITLDGQPSCDPKAGCANPLKLGMVVQVQGAFGASTGTAMRVDAEDVVKGPVESVAGDGLSLVVLGQTVLVDNTTVIDNNIGSSIAALKQGDLVEVHGFVKTVVSGDVVVATFIEKKGPLAEFNVAGFARNTNTITKTFTIGALTVDYHNANVNDLPGGNPVDGQLVEVKAQTAPAGGALIATKVEPVGLALADADEAEIEGFVTELVNNSTSDFFIGAQHVVTGSTVFVGGLQSDIAPGVKLEVEGSLAGSILTATKVSFRDNIELEADVAGVDVGANSFTLKGLSGISVTVDSQTEFKGNANAFGDIAVDNHVQVRGRLLSGNTNTVIATEVDESGNTDVILQGPIGAFTPPPSDSITILNVVINTTAILDGNFHGVDDTVVGRDAFYGGVKVGGLVKAKGTWGTSVTWKEVELED